MSYQVHPGVKGLDGGRVGVETNETVDEVSAEGRVDAVGRELPVVGPVVGPRAPVADHLLAVAGHTVFTMVGELVSLSIGDCQARRHYQQR